MTFRGILKEVDAVLFLTLGLGFLRFVVGLVGGSYAARYLWRECFLYFKGESQTLPWPIAAIGGFLVGIPLILAAICLWIYFQIEKKPVNTKTQ